MRVSTKTCSFESMFQYLLAHLVDHHVFKKPASGGEIGTHVLREGLAAICSSIGICSNMQQAREF